MTCRRWLGSALSSNIWKLKNIDLDGKEKYIGTNWVHVPLLMGAALDFVDKGSPAVIFEQGLVHVRHGNARWEQNFGNWYATGLRHLLVIKESIANRAPDIFNLYSNDRFRTNSRDLSLALETARLNFRLKLVVMSYKLFRNRSKYWIVDLPFLLMTARQRKFVTFFYMKIFRK